MKKILEIIALALFLSLPAVAYGVTGSGNAVIVGPTVLNDCLKSGGGVLIKDAGAPCGSGGGGGITIGDAITGGNDNGILYEDASGNIANKATFTFDGHSNIQLIDDNTALTTLFLRGDNSPTAQLELGASNTTAPGTILSFESVGGSAGDTVIYTSAANGVAPTEKFRITGAGAWGLTGANYGTSGYVITSQGAGVPPVWGPITATAAGTDTQIQVNHSGALGADAYFTWDYTNFILQLANPGDNGATARKVLQFNDGGAGPPGGAGVNSNGDKILFYGATDTSGVDNRIGTDGDGSFWFKGLQNFKWYQTSFSTPDMELVGGKLGIGNATPQARIDEGSSVLNSPSIYLYNDATNNNGIGIYNNALGGVSEFRLFTDTSGGTTMFRFGSQDNVGTFSEYARIGPSGLLAVGIPDNSSQNRIVASSGGLAGPGALGTPSAGERLSLRQNSSGGTPSFDSSVGTGYDSGSSAAYTWFNNIANGYNAAYRFFVQDGTTPPTTPVLSISTGASGATGSSGLGVGINKAIPGYDLDVNGATNSTTYLTGGVAGITSSTCSQWTNGLCTAP